MKILFRVITGNSKQSRNYLYQDFNFFCTGNYLKNLKPFYKQKIKKKF
jgi:hypothetical protein